jgi:hypothetical protein
MMPFLRSLLILLAFGAPAFSQDRTSSAAQNGAQDAAVAKQAAAAIETYLDGVKKSGGRPDYTKPPVSDWFHQVYDIEKLSALPPTTTADLSWLLDWTNAANKVNVLMNLFGATPGGGLDPAIFRRNQTDYEDQCVAAMNFLVRLEAIDATAMTGFMTQLPPEQRTPVREAGLQRMRKGAAEMIDGAVIWLAQGMRPENARTLTAALRDTKDVWATYILPDDRAKALVMLAQLQKIASDDEVQKNMAAVAAALNAAK